MVHQALILAMPVDCILEVERIGHARVEVQEVKRQQIVARIAARMDDPGAREERLDQPDVQEIVGPLVAQQAVVWRKAAAIEGTPLLNGRSGGFGNGVGIAFDAADERGNQVELATCSYPAVP